MSTTSKLTIAAVLLVFLGSIAAADLYVNENGLASLIPTGGNEDVTPPGEVVEDTDVTAVAIEQELALQETDEESLMEQIIGDREEVTTRVMLANGDRAGTVSWVDSSNVKTYFIALKEALLSTFSPEVRDLKDETWQEPGQPVRSVLTFLDPGISDERLVFVSRNNRLYEFHVTAGQEATVGSFIDALTSR